MVVLVNQRSNKSEPHEGTNEDRPPQPADTFTHSMSSSSRPADEQAPEDVHDIQHKSSTSFVCDLPPTTTLSSRNSSSADPTPQKTKEEKMAAAAVEEIRASSYVGFDSITRQIEHKLLKRGFQFNVMVVGQTGLGKSTLINTIFASHLIDSKGRFGHDEPVRQTTEIQTVSHVIAENGVKLKLNIVDTPGYGDQINNEGCWDTIIKYIKDQHSAYLRKELTAMRDRHIQDTRIHCCLFFLNPTGHQLRPIDIIVMKKLSEVVNVVPVIAKADSLTLEERDAFKARIKEDLEFHNIRLYPIDHEDNDEEETSLNERIRGIIPFAVVGSERNVIIEGKPVRGRKNRWGVINVEDERHCEFVYLRNFLLRTHLQDLIETTAQIHYEAFRSKQLLALKDASSRPAAAPAA
ncbi:Septin homolog spn2 [Schizosaccharomyces pombe 972h-] [Rhizoctonia solani]|uniref:Septin homolog spn2 [Schizosaccharomyces pombe 972h-] n=1 Tax=Rhizoctonia solani TaxID=456999 RepID=A0A0K6FVM1_9AGAM|nr:Septin homolog spn2 [Schizosaccharomyces pombe 972h-] [Rhizoctonia solani]